MKHLQQSRTSWKRSSQHLASSSKENNTYSCREWERYRAAIERRVLGA